ncbi:MAG: CAP domain-containing protein [Gammaproteobacteria bacterium]
MKNIVLVLLSVLISATSQAMTSQDAHEVLNAHNKFRAQHSAPNLVWDTKLADYAERYASKCKFQHSHSGYGENIAAGYPSISTAIRAWYVEGANYSYHLPGFSYHTGHFTQLVWKSSKKLGCGYATCNGNNGTPGKYLVCEYSPAGNITNRNYFKANVLPS